MAYDNNKCSNGSTSIVKRKIPCSLVYGSISKRSAKNGNGCTTSIVVNVVNRMTNKINKPAKMGKQPERTWFCAILSKIANELLTIFIDWLTVWKTLWINHTKYQILIATDQKYHGILPTHNMLKFISDNWCSFRVLWIPGKTNGNEVKQWESGGKRGHRFEMNSPWLTNQINHGHYLNGCTENHLVN